MKLATFNVNGIASRLKHLLQWLEKESPDVVCLQELKAPEAGLPVKAIRDAGYGALWRGQKSWDVVPTDLDIYNPRSWRKDALLQPESRERYQRLLEQGWVDAIRSRHPDEPIYTFWDYFRKHWERNAGLRIDHLLLSKQLAPRLVDAGVDTWVRDLPKASDHAPAWVELDWPRERSEEHTSELQSRFDLVCRLLLEKK